MSIVNCDSFSKITTPTGNDGIMFNDYVLVQEKQKYLDGLLDLCGYQKQTRSLCCQCIKVFYTIDKDDFDYVPKQG